MTLMPMPQMWLLTTFICQTVLHQIIGNGGNALSKGTSVIHTYSVLLATYSFHYNRYFTTHTEQIALVAKVGVVSP